MNSKKYECPLCGELLAESKKGQLTNPKTGEVLKVYDCEECEQSFIYKDKKIQIIPYRPDGTPIRHTCQYCGKIENFDQNVVFLFNVPKMDVYCLECGVEVLRNWLRKNPNADVEKVTKENLEEVSQLHEVVEANKFFANPDNKKKMDEMSKMFQDKFKEQTEKDGNK